MRVERFIGPDRIAPLLPQLARLRIEVFADYPYLYDGDLDYEERYLSQFAASPDALVAGAFDGTRLVGAATAAPMEDHAEDFAAAFAGSGLDLKEIFYLAESVLLPEYRGRGLGHAFFDHREAQARALGREYCAFCSVIRGDHPAKPAGYRPLDGFWHKRGYAPWEGIVAEFSWKDIGQSEETAKKLQFWGRQAPQALPHSAS